MQELSQNSGSDISRHTSLADQCKQKLELFFFFVSIKLYRGFG